MFADVLVKLFPARARRSLFRVLGLLQRWVPEGVEEEACDMLEKLREAFDLQLQSWCSTFRFVSAAGGAFFFFYMFTLSYHVACKNCGQ